MTASPDLDGVYVPSQNIVARKIEGELIIVPLVAGMGDLEDELFSLNDTGKDIWEKLDGQRSLGQVVAELADEYTAEKEVIEKDVVGLLAELIKRGIVEPAPGPKGK